jgi:DNA polymerase I-like protein with 3'-5' exonuclease and polymerase domains
VRTGRVYDILNSGPHNRFQAGHHIVHNCYGVAGPGIAGMLAGEGIKRDADTCEGYIDKFFRERPKVKVWIDRVQEATRDDTISRSLFGRARRLEQVRSRINSVVSRAERQAINHVIQSTASDMTMTSLTLMDQEIALRSGAIAPHILYPTIDPADYPVTPGWDKVHIVLTVHDSIVFDCPRSMAGEVVEMGQRVMPNVVDLAYKVWGPEIAKQLLCLKRVPMVADFEVGYNYRDAVGVKSPADVDRAMFVAHKRRAAFDANPKFDWTGDLEKACAAEFDAQQRAVAEGRAP